MSVNSKIKEQIQKLSVGEFITLFEIDTSIYGGITYYFTPNTVSGTQFVGFGGNTYIPIPAQITGYKLSANGALERPSLAVANTDRAFNYILESYNNLNGCIVTIRSTFRQYLDDGDDPDSAAQAEPQIFKIHQKTAHTKDTIQWELSAVIDNQKAMIPRNIVAAEKCIARYRTWDSDVSNFVYNTSKLACPYTGSNYYDDTGSITTADKDKCSKDLYGCRLRYPDIYGDTGDPMPYMQFSSIDRG